MFNNCMVPIYSVIVIFGTINLVIVASWFIFYSSSESLGLFGASPYTVHGAV